MKKLLLFFLFVGSAFSQVTSAGFLFVPSAPSGGCNSAYQTFQWVIPNGPFYFCNGAPGTWTPFNSGSGAVQSVTATPPINSTGGPNPNISFTGILGTANGGTGSSVPLGLVGALTTTFNSVGVTETPIVTAPIPANSIGAQTTYTIQAECSGSSSTSQVNSFFVRYGAAGTSADLQIGLITTVSNTTGSNLGFVIRATVIFRSSVQSSVTGSYESAGTTGLANLAFNAPFNIVTSALVTTTAKILQLSFASGAATTTLTCSNATIVHTGL